MSVQTADVVVIGAGIAGASAAACLAESLTVVLLEREAFPGMHSTGRSAALFSEIYGSAPVRALSRASREFLYCPPPGFAASAIVRPRGALHIASSAQLAKLSAFCDLPDIGGSVLRLSGDEARAACPILKGDYVSAAALETASADVDVDVLHQGWLRLLKARGGSMSLDAEVTTLSRAGSGWRVETRSGTFDTPVVINAAGAWADEIASLGGVQPIGLQPRRRTALVVAAPEGETPDEWPMVIDVDEQFYFRPDAGGLLLSPGDETASEPCDAQPDEWDIAVAIDRIQAATTLEVRRVKRSWAGLRNFVADRSPVVGFAPDARGSSGWPARAATASRPLRPWPLWPPALVIGSPLPSGLAEAGVSRAISARRGTFLSHH